MSCRSWIGVVVFFFFWVGGGGFLWAQGKREEKGASSGEKKAGLRKPPREWSPPPKRPLDRVRLEQELRGALERYFTFLEGGLKAGVVLLKKELNVFRRGMYRFPPRWGERGSGEFARMRLTLEELGKVQGFWLRTPLRLRFGQVLLDLEGAQRALLGLLRYYRSAVKKKSPLLWHFAYGVEWELCLGRVRGWLEALEKGSAEAVVKRVWGYFLRRVEELEKKYREAWGAVWKAFLAYVRGDQLLEKEVLQAFERRYHRRKVVLYEVLWKYPSPAKAYVDEGGQVYLWGGGSWRRLGGLEGYIRACNFFRLASLPWEEKGLRLVLGKLSKAELGERYRGFLEPFLASQRQFVSLLLKELGLHSSFYQKQLGVFLDKLFALLYIKPDWQKRFWEIKKAYSSYWLLEVELTTAPPSQLRMSVSPIQKEVDFRHPFVLIPSSVGEVSLSAWYRGFLLSQKIVVGGQGYMRVIYEVDVEDVPSSKEIEEAGKFSLNLVRLGHRLKKPLKKAVWGRWFFPERLGRSVGYRFLSSALLEPFELQPLPDYRFLVGERYSFLAKVRRGDGLLKELLEFDKKHRRLSELYTPPPHLVQRVRGGKLPLIKATTLCRQYWKALEEKNRELAIELYNRISGDKDGQKMVDEWLYYKNLLEKYKRQDLSYKREEFRWIYQEDDVVYLKRLGISGKVMDSKAGALSPYDSNLTARDLKYTDIVLNSVKESEGERLLERRRQEQHRQRLRQLQEYLKEVGKDWGPKENAGGLRNVRLKGGSRRVEIKFFSTEEDGGSVDVKVNGKRLLFDKKLGSAPHVLEVELREGYNTLEIFARRKGSSGFTSGVLEISGVREGDLDRARQSFDLDLYEVGTLTMYLPSLGKGGGAKEKPKKLKMVGGGK